MAIKAVAQKAPGYQALAPITHLPRAITLLFLLRIPGNQMARMQCVSQFFKHLLTHDRENFWKRLCQRDFPGRAIPSNIQTYLHYQRCFITEQNWIKGRYIYQRLNNCRSVLMLSSRQLFCSGPNFSLQIWDLNNLSSQTVEGFPGDDTLDIYMHDEEVVICGANSGPTGGACFKVWDRATSRLLWKRDRLLDLILDGDKLVIPRSTYNSRAQGYNGQIEICEKKTGKRLLQILDPELDVFLFSIRLKCNHIFASPLSPGGFFKYWDKQTGALICKVGSTQDPLSIYEPDGTIVVCGFINGKIRVLNQENGTTIQDLSDLEGEGQIACLVIDEEVILAATSTYHFACWNKANRNLLFKIQAEPVVNPQEEWNTRKQTRLFLKGSRILWKRDRENVEIRDKDTGALVKSFSAGTILRDDGTHIFSVHQKILQIWDRCSGEIVGCFSQDNIQWIFGDRMIIQRPLVVEQDTVYQVDICDFSAIPEIAFPLKAQLPTPPKS